MKKLRFKGVYEIAFSAPGFTGQCKDQSGEIKNREGLVLPGDEIVVDEVAFDELKGHEDWEAVVEAVEKKKSTEKGDK